MNTVWNRSNNVLTLASIVAAILGICASLTDFATVPSMPAISVPIHKIQYLRRNRDGDDQIGLQMSLQADLRPYWTWNTKMIFVYVQAEYSTSRHPTNQVSVWDEIVTSEAAARLDKRISQEYVLVDRGQNFRNREINMTVTWNIIPRIGALRTYSSSSSVGALPGQYFSDERAWKDRHAIDV